MSTATAMTIETENLTFTHDPSNAANVLQARRSVDLDVWVVTITEDGAWSIVSAHDDDESVFASGQCEDVHAAALAASDYVDDALWD